MSKTGRSDSEYGGQRKGLFFGPNFTLVMALKSGTFIVSGR